MEFRWIQISLFLTALLQITAATDEVKTVRAGEDVTLSCENLIQNQPECSYTTWSFEGVGYSFVDLIRLGQISENTGAKSDRLSVTEDCSLVIKKVTEEDVGRYVCCQFTPGGRQEPDADVFLSLLNMTATKNGDRVTLRCFVRTSGHLPCKVKWLFEDEDEDDLHQSVVTSQRFCYTHVTFKIDHRVYKSRHDSLQCKVTEGKKERWFPFSLQPSGEKPGEDNDNRKPPTTTKKSTAAPRPTEDGLTAETTPASGNQPSVENDLSWLYVTVAVVLLTALLVIVVIVIRRKRTKGNETQRNDDAKDPEEGVSYASIRYAKKKMRKTQARGKGDDGDDEDGAVTYATVKASSSSSPAADPSSLYATINKEKSPK